SHALYIVPTWYLGPKTEPARSGPGEVPPTTGWNKLGLNPTTSPTPTPTPPVSPLASLDEVATASPWDGVVPGKKMVLLDDDTPVTREATDVSTTKVLQDSQRIAGGDVELGYAVGDDGGGTVPGGDEGT